MVSIRASKEAGFVSPEIIKLLRGVPLQCPSQETFSLATDEGVKRGKETNRFDVSGRKLKTSPKNVLLS